MSELIINNLKVGLNNQPLIIAEMSGNHNQSLERALEITDKELAVMATLAQTGLMNTPIDP